MENGKIKNQFPLSWQFLVQEQYSKHFTQLISLFNTLYFDAFLYLKNNCSKIFNIALIFLWEHLSALFHFHFALTLFICLWKKTLKMETFSEKTYVFEETIARALSGNIVFELMTSNLYRKVGFHLSRLGTI